MTEVNNSSPSDSTGIPGLDHILFGGLPAGMTYLLHGKSGTGKTTLGLQFLIEGVRRGQRVLFASLLQRRRELEKMLASHGWSLDGIDLLDLPESIRQMATEEQTLFSPGEIELQEVAEAITGSIERHRPQRVLFDSITELAMLVDNTYQLRRQMLKFKERLDENACTALFTANEIIAVDLPSLQTAVHGVIELGIDRSDYGPLRRWLEVIKVRGLEFICGRHDFRLRTGGIEVYPRLEIPGDVQAPLWSTVSSGNKELDMLFGGGLEEGTACLIMGTTGAGKSTLASIYAQAAAERGERSIIFCFDERRQTFIHRSEGLGLDIVRHMKDGMVDLRQVDFGRLTLGEFVHDLCDTVSQQRVKVVVIDSLTGFSHAIPERQLTVRLHELLSYLGNAGVLTLLVVPTRGFGAWDVSDLDENISYLADTVIVMRHFEATGEMRRCVSVLKKRHGNHERSIREIKSGPGGIRVGPPLIEFRNVLSGRPEYIGRQGKLIDSEHDAASGQDDVV